MRYEYLIVLAATLFFPLILSRDKNIALHKHPRALFASILMVAIPFWVWDVLVTARGHWSFNPQYVLGISLLGMPVEEWLFFVVVPFVSIFTWESVKYFLQRRS